VVLLASGMDSRAYRLDWPSGVRLYELDQPDVLAFKQHVLDSASATPRCELRTVGVDLREDWPAALREAGFRPGEPTAWLTEGLLYALDETASDALLNQISALSAPGSVLAFDHVQESQALRDALTAIDPELLRLWQSGPTDPADWLRRHGWEPRIAELADVSRDYGRAVHLAYDSADPQSAHSWLATASTVHP
jgi:methyltransferase (TIGR00027 family)